MLSVLFFSYQVVSLQKYGSVNCANKPCRGVAQNKSSLVNLPAWCLHNNYKRIK